MRAQFSVLGVAALASSIVNAMPSTLEARALPQVSAVAKPRACSSYPTFNSATGEATEFIFYADSTEEPVLSGAGTVVGNLANTNLAIARIGIAVRQDLAKSVTKCFPDGGEEGLRTRTHGDWRRLTLSGSDDENIILVGQGPVAHRPLTPHDHFFANGTQQPGVFMGDQGSTTWAFSRKNANACQSFDQYEIRLLKSADSPLKDGEFRGFVRAG
ncbi:hypothetical protein MCOR25_008347 [Pyricularia grisea]|uniref:Uncharacterized protein n=1 Tax=Pyricularia grisea TaxID=148305 RepID=A0A6P8BGM9_PYRGI|nr:uncharacterized protein PgNI_01622 [Pyricularia grisea]KAI6355096.1 hypothetical protein MCOR25_008347 [Pyricularia grisea]TLD15938.1 hypothetical protein PgNI_01622 [Pyricularia grisea]